LLWWWADLALLISSSRALGLKKYEQNHLCSVTLAKCFAGMAAVMRCDLNTLASSEQASALWRGNAPKNFFV
jgi:hypothetical protein